MELQFHPGPGQYPQEFCVFQMSVVDFLLYKRQFLYRKF